MTQVIRRKTRKESSESNAAAFAEAAKRASIPLKPKKTEQDSAS